MSDEVTIVPVCDAATTAPNYRGTSHAETSFKIDRNRPFVPVAKEKMIMSKSNPLYSNPIYVELVYVLMAVVVAVAIRVNLPSHSVSKPDLVAVPCDCMEI